MAGVKSRTSSWKNGEFIDTRPPSERGNNPKRGTSGAVSDHDPRAQEPSPMDGGAVYTGPKESKTAKNGGMGGGAVQTSDGQGKFLPGYNSQVTPGKWEIGHAWRKKGKDGK